MHQIRAVLPYVLVTSVLTAQDARAPQPLALTHVTVVDVRDGSLHRDQTVIIRGERITAAGAAGETTVPDAARVIHGRGRYLIPGLWDMHVHLFNQVSRRPPNLWHFPLFIANGVTGVREMWTRTADAATLADWRGRIAAGDMLGPRIRAAGALVDGRRSWWPTAAHVETADEAGRFVQDVRRSGLDFVKVYSNLSREAYFAILSEARRVGLPVAGHIPMLVRGTEAAEAGQRSNEHLHQVLEACSTAERQILEERQRLYARAFTAAEDDELWDRHEDLRARTYDENTCSRIARQLAAAGQWQVPTLVNARRWFFGRMDTHDSDAGLAYVSSDERRVWREGYAKYGVRSSELASLTSSAERDEKMRRWKATLAVVRTLRGNGVPLLAGTDLGGPYIYPGFSLHDEIALLVDAGLTPVEALQTATVNPARFLNLTDSLGTVEPGKLADLVLLDANPLENIRNTQKIAAVVLNGRYLDRRALDDLLASASRAAQQPSNSLVEAVVYTTLRPPNWDIYLFDKPGGAPRRLTDDPALDYNAVFSPDGRWVVFTSERTGNTDLYAFDLKSGGPPIRLTQHHGMDDAASFSPDGRRLAFVSTRDGYADIFVISFAPGYSTAEYRAVNLTRRPGGDFNPTFSPDGRRIAFSRQERWDDLNTPLREDQAVELYLMDADGSNVRRLSTSSAGLPGPGRPASSPLVSGSPAWSRNGQAIYYYRLRAEGFEIRRITPDGSGDVHIVPDGFSPAVRPDGRIAFVRPPAGADRRPTAGDVVSVAADGSDRRNESEALDSCFAPDFDRGSGRMVCHGPGPIDGLAVVGDGRAFAPPDAIRQVRLPDRPLTVRGIRGFFPALTPAGEVISTLRGISADATRAGETQTMTVPLHVSAVEGSGLRELFKPPSGVSWGAAVARDAGWLVTAVGPPFAGDDARVDIWKLRIDGSDAVNLTPESSANDAFPHISADGRRIVFRSSRGGHRAVYVMDSGKTDPRRLTDTDARETMPALSPEGEWVVFAILSGAEFAGGRRDSRRLGNSSVGGKLWLQRVDGSEHRLLQPERAHIADFSLHPRFSPDGKWVVFTSDRGGFNDEWPLTWFPQPYGELWAVPVSGGAAVRLTHDKWEDGPSDWGYARLPHRQP